MDCLPSLSEAGAERDLIQIGNKFSEVSGRERDRKTERLGCGSGDYLVPLNGSLNVQITTFRENAADWLQGLIGNGFILGSL